MEKVAEVFAASVIVAGIIICFILCFYIGMIIIRSLGRKRAS